MSDTPTQSTGRVDEIIGGYLRSQEQGNPPPRDELLREHPDLAEELREFFADQDRLKGAAGGLPGELPQKKFVPLTVRYFGDYELLDEIARGGMGVVYKARQTSLNRTVAIKMILSGQIASEEDLKRFRTEAEAAANLQHPGIVAVHEVGEHEGLQYFSMDYIEGRSLAKIVRENPLPARKAATYVRAIAEAVHYAHQQGTLHRDLKPSNVLIDGEDQVHVTDFGLAGRVDGEGDLTQSGQILGTASYMPPEQAEGKRGLIRPASDVYSIGATLYCLLTARPPFRAESSVETLQQVIETEPVSPRLLNPTVPRDLETICLKCLRKEPERRYCTAREVAEDLSRWLDGKPIQARPVSRAEKTWMWCRRRPTVAGSIVAILLTVCIVTGFTLVQQQRNIRKRVETAVAATGTAHGDVVPSAIEDLEAFPREIVLSELREQIETSHKTERLPLAFALARFGDVRVDYFISRIRDASPEEVDNFVAALGHSRPQAVSTLEAVAKVADGREDWRQKARLAMLALHLNSPSLARDMCKLRPDPIQRAWFIGECSTWHGDLSKLAQLLANIDDVPMRSAVALAAGSAPVADVAVAEKQAWAPVLSRWYQDEPDTPTHSAAGWTLRKWGLTLPDIPETTKLIENRNWYANSVGMTMLLIPAGTFVRADRNSRNQVVILTRPFLLADREVTRGQFQHFIEDREYPGEEQPLGWKGADVASNPASQYPVQQVSWYDAILFCNWLSLREGLTPCYERTREQETIDNVEHDAWRLISAANGYRLPTDAEWEYACRAGTRTTFSHGDDEPMLDRYAVLQALQTEFSDSTLPNGWGFSDMRGNVLEWCNDWYAPFGNESIVTDPTGPPAPASGRGMGRRVTHGGSWRHFLVYRELDFRSGCAPHIRSSSSGIRVARTPDIEELSDGILGRRAVELIAPALDCADLKTLLELIARIEDYGVTLTDMIESRPDNPRLLTLLAKRQAVAGNMTLAAESLAKASSRLEAQLSQSAVDETLVRLLIDLLVSQIEDSSKLLERGDLIVAIAAFERAIELDRTSARAYLTLGDTLAGTNAIEAGVEAYRQATELDPTDASAHWVLGRALRRSGHLTEAITACQRAYELDPGNVTFQTEFVETCLDAGESQTAIAAVRRRLESKPVSCDDFYLLARLLRYTADVLGYREVCGQMFDEFSTSDDLPSRHALASAWLFFRDAEVTPELFAIAEANAERGFQIHKRMLGLAYYRLRDDEQALPILKEAAAAQLPPNSRITSLLCLALAQLRAGDLDGGRTSIRHAFILQQNSPEYSDSKDRQPWGAIPSLWREVQEAMEAAEIKEPIPRLPPTYAEWPKITAAEVVTDPDE